MEGVFLDPVYTSKAFAGLIDHIRKGKISSDQAVIFLHREEHQRCLRIIKN